MMIETNSLTRLSVQYASHGQFNAVEITLIACVTLQVLKGYLRCKKTALIIYDCCLSQNTCEYRNCCSQFLVASPNKTLLEGIP